MASSVLPPNQNPQQGPPGDFTPDHIFIVLRFTQLTCRELYDGTIPADIFATEILPQMLPSLHALLRRYGREVAFQENLIADAPQSIADIKNSGDIDNLKRVVDAAVECIEEQLRNVELEFRYLREFMDSVRGAMEALDDNLVGLDEEILWEDIKRYYDDVDESIEERVKKMRNQCHQLLEQAE